MQRQNRSDVNEVIEFLYVNVDFFSAQFTNEEKFQLWVSFNQEDSLLKDMNEILLKKGHPQQIIDLSQDMNEIPLKKGDRRERITDFSHAICGKTFDPNDKKNSLLQGNKLRIKNFLEKNLDIVAMFKQHMDDPIINVWYRTQATEFQREARKKRRGSLSLKREKKIEAREQRIKERDQRKEVKQKLTEKEKQVLKYGEEAQEKLIKYIRASSEYKIYLKEEVIKEIHKINDKLLKRLSATVNSKMDKGDVYQELANNLIKYYKIPAIHDTVDKLLKDEPKLLIALKKHQVIKEAMSLLKIDRKKLETDIQSRINYFDQKAGEFESYLEKNKDILTTRRDSGFSTFVKAVGVVAATIFGVGYGGYSAYKRLFGTEYTRGHKYLSEVTNIKDEVSNVEKKPEAGKRLK